MPASVPAWVPVLFVVLLFLGYRQSLPRTVRPGALVAIALAMFGLSFYGVVGAFGMEPPALLAWAAGYATSLSLSAKQLASRLTATGARVRVPGSWVPLALLLGIFMAKFVLGFAAAVHSPVLHHQGFILAMSAAFGALSGGFGARAIAVHRCAAANSAA